MNISKKLREIAARLEASDISRVKGHRPGTRILPQHHVVESSCLVTTVGEAPVGLLLLLDGEIICKSEYRLAGRCECTIVSSGEAYHGKGDEAPCIPFNLVLLEYKEATS